MNLQSIKAFKALYVFGLCYALLALSACASSSKLISQGRYDEAIERSVRHLHKKPTDHKEIDILKDAFRLAVLKDEETIYRARLDSLSHVWDVIYEAYMRMSQREDRLNGLPEAVRSSLAYSYTSYAEQIEKARRNAMAYHYREGHRLLESSNRLDARLAYEHFGKLGYYDPEFPDLINLKETALEKGTTLVGIRIENRTNQYVSPISRDAIMPNLRSISSFWVKVYDIETLNYTPDYEISVVIHDIYIDPPRSSRREISETAQISDGYKYLEDKNGKPILDSLGNFIKVEKFITVRCRLITQIDQVEVHMAADILFVDKQDETLVGRQRAEHHAVFQQKWSIAKGDPRALSKAQRHELRENTLPIPMPQYLIEYAAEGLGSEVHTGLRNGLRNWVK